MSMLHRLSHDRMYAWSRTMQPLAYNSIRLGVLLGLVFLVGTVQAQTAGPTDQPSALSAQPGSMPGQGGQEGMRGGQSGMGQMTCV
jgi:hypothetical protein